MLKLKWYCHQSHSCPSQIQEELERLNLFMNEEKGMPKLAQELYNYFYEVEFDVEVNELTGKIMKVSLAPKNIKKIEDPGLSKTEMAFLEFVSAHCVEPYATMASNAILWRDRKAYQGLKNKFPQYYS